jgi:hypothetical protein
MHMDLVRTVALGEDFVLSGSYDLTIKVGQVLPVAVAKIAYGCVCLSFFFYQVWDRKTGALVADLTGGHNGRIFCIGFDSKKVRAPSMLTLDEFSFSVVSSDCVMR